MADGRGGVVVLVAEAGAGKTRLAVAAAAAATARGCPVLTGRAVPGAHPVPYRALVEAFLGAFRSAPVPDSPDLAGLGAHLGRLVPAWRREDGAAEDSPLLLAEAVLRLLRTAARAGPRPRGGGPALGRPGNPRCPRLPRRRPPHGAGALRGPRRDPKAEPRSCSNGSSGETPPRSSASRRWPRTTSTGWSRRAWPPRRRPPGPGFIRAHGDGTPFLVEELLAGLVAAGTLRHEGGVWAAGDELTPTVPASLRESIRAPRGPARSHGARGSWGAAAMLGRRFDWELLPGIADVDGRGVVDALRAAVDAQIVAVNGDGFIFRHALTREAVLGDLLPPSAGGLAQQAWPAVERARRPPPARSASWPRSWRRRQARPRPPPSGWSRARGARSPPGRSPPGKGRRAAPAVSPRPTTLWRATPTRALVRRARGRGQARRGHGNSEPRGCCPFWRPAHGADLLVGLAHTALTAGDGTAAERDVGGPHGRLPGAGERATRGGRRRRRRGGPRPGAPG